MPHPSTCPILLLSLTLSTACFPPSLHAQEQKGARPQLNEAFQKPDVKQFVDRFESESREVFSQRHAIVKWLGLQPGMVVADIGAGTGAFTIPMAQAVGPRGDLFAVDISEDFVRFIADRTDHEGLHHVCPVLCTQTSCRLPASSVDLAFVCDAYHHFEHPAETLASIHRALKPGGQLVVIDFDRTDSASDFIKGHVRAPKEVFFKEIEAAGFQLLESPDAPPLKENFAARFRRIEPSSNEDAR